MVPEVTDRATKVPLPYVTDHHKELDGNVAAVHVIPSGDTDAEEDGP